MQLQELRLLASPKGATNVRNIQQIFIKPSLQQ